MSEKNVISIQEAAEHGYFDVLDILSHPEKYEKRAYRAALQHANRYKYAAPYVKGKTVVDAACGTGYGYFFLKKGGCTQYVGIDLEVSNIEQGKKDFPQKDAHFLQADLNIGCDVGDQKDVVVSFETIEHVEDAHSYLQFVGSILKEGGDFIVSTPNRKITNPGGTLESKPLWDFHVREWILPEFIELLESHGFEIVKVRGQSFTIPRSILPSDFLIRIGRNLTKRVLPLFPFRFISEPNFFIVHCKKR